MEEGCTHSASASDNCSTFQTDTGKRNALQITVSAFFLLLIILLALVGNVMVIVGVRTFSVLRKEKSNIFIVNLGVTDFLSGIIVMMSSFTSLVSDKWLFGESLCDFVCATNYCLIIVSMLTLCFISIDRYQAVIHPLHYPTRMTQRKICTMTAYTWVQGILFACVPVIFRWVHYDYWEVICAIAWHEDPRALSYVIAAFVLCFFLPGAVLVFCYVHILKEAKKCRIEQDQTNQLTNAFNSEENHTQRKKRNSNSKIIQSLIFVVLAYFVCLTPFCVTKLLKVIFNKPDFVPSYVNLTASWFGYMSSAINPLIYGIFRRDFRVIYLKLLNKLCIFKKYSNNSTSTEIFVTGGENS